MNRQTLRTVPLLLAATLLTLPALAKRARDQQSPSLQHLRPALTAGAFPGWTDQELAYEALLLDASGTWVENGACGGPSFRPRVPAGWRPFTSGYWGWTPEGATWVPAEPWGWLPHHYGSWTRDAAGWSWCPGDGASLAQSLTPAWGFCCSWGWEADDGWEDLFVPGVLPPGGRFEPGPRTPRGPVQVIPAGPRGGRGTPAARVEARVEARVPATHAPDRGHGSPTRSEQASSRSDRESAPSRSEPSSPHFEPAPAHFDPAPARFDPPAPAPAPAPSRVDAPDRRN